MLYKMTELSYKPTAHRARARRALHPPRRPRAELLDQRGARDRSSLVDPYSAIAGGIAALYGPSHGGANEEVVRMLHRIGSRENIPTSSPA